MKITEWRLTVPFNILTAHIEYLLHRESMQPVRTRISWDDSWPLIRVDTRPELRFGGDWLRRPPLIIWIRWLDEIHEMGVVGLRRPPLIIWIRWLDAIHEMGVPYLAFGRIQEGSRGRLEWRRPGVRPLLLRIHRNEHRFSRPIRAFPHFNSKRH